LHPKKRLALAPINQQILDTSAKLDSYIKDFQPWTMPEIEPWTMPETWTMPEIPYAYANQNIWAFPAQLRPRNGAGNAIGAGAAGNGQNPGQPIPQPQPPLAMHNGRRIKPVDIGRMDIICTKCSAKRFPKEADGMTAHKQ
jgi:hypothetical protein